MRYWSVCLLGAAWAPDGVTGYPRYAHVRVNKCALESLTQDTRDNRTNPFTCYSQIRKSVQPNWKVLDQNVISCVGRFRTDPTPPTSPPSQLGRFQPQTFFGGVPGPWNPALHCLSRWPANSTPAWGSKVIARLCAPPLVRWHWYIAARNQCRDKTTCRESERWPTDPSGPAPD